MTKFFTILILASVLLCGCIFRHPCTKSYITPVFIGFNRADVDTIILRAYEPNDNYQHLVDTFLVNDKHYNIYTERHDTTFVYINTSDKDEWISSGFDWKIVIPAKKREVKVSDIISIPIEDYGNCYNPVGSFVQDGEKVVPPFIASKEFYTKGYMIYIHN